MYVLSSYSAFIVIVTGEFYTGPSHPCYLVVVDEFLQFIGVDDNMQATHLGKTELFPIYTGKTHLEENHIKQCV